MKNLYFTFFLLFAIVGSSYATVQHTVLPNGGILVQPFHPLTVDGTDFGFEYDPSTTGIWVFEQNFNGLHVLTNGFDDLRLFASGDTLSQAVSLNVDGTTAFTHQPGNEPAGIHYIGLKSANGNFAWVKIDVNPGVSYTILEYAIEDDGSDLVAGSTTSIGGSGVGLNEQLALEVEILQNIEAKSLNIRINEGQFKVSIYDINGRNILSLNTETTIDLSGFKKGLYAILVEANGTAFRKKIMVL